MLHRTIRHDDFKRNKALHCWNNVVTIRNNVATILQSGAALKIVVANRLVYSLFSELTQQDDGKKRTAKRLCVTKRDRPITYVFCGDPRLIIIIITLF